MNHTLIINKSDIKTKRGPKGFGGSWHTDRYCHLITGDTCDLIMISLNVSLAFRNSRNTWEISNNILKKLRRMNNVSIIAFQRKVKNVPE